MENQTCFDLKTAVARWREGSAGTGMTSEELDELQAHLEDAVHDLGDRGLTPEEAFLIADRRLGAARPLADQFTRSDSEGVWMDRLFWGGVMLLVLYLWQTLAFTTVYMAVGNLLRRLGFGNAWSTVLVFALILAPMLVVAFVLTRSTSPRLRSRLASLLPVARRLAPALVIVGLGFLAVQIASWWEAASHVTVSSGVTRRIDFWGTMLGNLLWPGTAVIIMLGTHRRRRRSVA